MIETLLSLTVNGVLIGGLYALAALGLTIVLGVMRVINVSHGAFYTLGAYFTFLFSIMLGFSYITSFLLSAALVFAIGVVYERLLIKPIRKEELNVLILTFAGAFVIEEIVKFAFGPRYRNIPPYLSGTVTIPGGSVDVQRVLSFAIAIAIVALLFAILRFTKIGKAMRMVAEDEEVAGILGINVERVQMFSFGFGAMLAASAAALLSPIYLLYPSMGWDPLLKAFAIVIFGGMGSIPGTVLTGIIFGVAEVLTGYYISPTWKTVVPFILLILIISVKPTGLFGEEE